LPEKSFLIKSKNTYGVDDVVRTKPERSVSPALKKRFYSKNKFLSKKLPLNLSIFA